MSVNSLASRLQYLGGNQLERINKQKLNSLRSALKNSYQTHMIKTPLHAAGPALINNNPAGIKSDYDKKYISVEHNAQLEPGDVFEDLTDNTHWMIYLPILTETAYLRSEIVRCRYTLAIEDDVYGVYFQGPTETDLRWRQKQGINFNELNLSGTIYIKLNEQTRSFFERFTHIKVDNHIGEVQVTDSISVPGVLELEVQEYYDNPVAELPEIISEVEEDTPTIIGETMVKQDTVVGYTVSAENYKRNAQGTVSGNDRVRLKNVLEDGRTCEVRVYQGAIGTYTISYGDLSLDVTIDGAQPYIKGNVVVTPYEFYTYRGEGYYYLSTDLAQIVEQDGKRCKIEILSGRTGEFTLYCKLADGTIEELPIKIQSWFGGKDESTVGIVS